MNRLTLTALTAGLLLLLVGMAYPSPRLVIPEPEFDFGFVPQNARISHAYWLHSAGDDTLKILKVIPGCGCTKAPLEKEILAKGDSTRLEVVFDTKSYSNLVVKQPKIETNEALPEKSVRFSANVVRRPDSTYPVIIKPYKLDVSQFGEKVRDQITFTVKNVSDSALTLNVISMDPNFFTLDLPRELAPGGTATGVLALQKAKLDSSFEKSFTFELGDAAKSRFTVPVTRTKRIVGQTNAATTTGQKVN